MGAGTDSNDGVRSAPGEEPSPEPAQLDALRRRLYQPGANDADRASYRAASALTPVPAPVPAAVRAPAERPSARDRPPQEDADDAAADAAARPTPSRAGERRIALLVVAGVIAAAAILALTSQAQQHPPLPPSPTRAVAPTAAAVDLPPVVRAGFVRRLRAGRRAGFAAYFGRNPDARPAQLTTLTRAVTDEYDRAGEQAVRLEPPSAADHGGRFTVIVILASSGEVRWGATRPAVRTNHEPYAQAVADHRGTQSSGTPISVTIPYTGTAPTLLRVRPPQGGRWDAVVVFSD